MKKSKAQKMFDRFFKGKRRILEHFGAEKTNHCDHEFDQIDDEWAIIGDSVVWGPGQIPGQPPIPLSLENCGFDQPISDGVFRAKHFTLVFMRLEMGGADAAAIFDNSKEQVQEANARLR